MAQIFTRNADDGWSVTPLTAKAVELSGATPVEIANVSTDVKHSHSLPEIHLSESAGKEVWALLIPAEFQIWVNGRRVSQIRILRHRDSIWSPGSDAVFFSTEKLAKVEVYPGHSERLDCPRCKLPIREGHEIVVCPGCSTAHHMLPAEDLPCWTYNATCSACSYSSDMSDDLRWVPEIA